MPLPLSAALQQLLALAPPPPAPERLELRADTLGALPGRVLAEALTAARDHPDAPRSRMDGYALHSEDAAPGQVLAVSGASGPAEPRSQLPPGTAWKIATGAAVPQNADRIVPVEETEPLPPGADGNQRIRLNSSGSQDWIRPQGEDFRTGQELLPPGTLLRQHQLPLIAASGQHQIAVHGQLRVAFLRLGGELAQPGQPLRPGQQYDLNGPLLAAELARLSVHPLDLGTVADNLDQLCTNLQQAATTADLILTSGGASVGDEDFLAPALKRLGRVHFHRLALRPGMPFLAGQVGDTLLLGMPGNPQSVFATFHLLATPLIRQMQGARDTSVATPLTARLTTQLHNDSQNTLWLQALYHPEQTEVSPLTPQHSALVLPLARANCALALPPDTKLHPGDSIKVWPYHSL